jgi:hypothetical protein
MGLRHTRVWLLGVVAGVVLAACGGAGAPSPDLQASAAGKADFEAGEARGSVAASTKAVASKKPRAVGILARLDMPSEKGDGSGRVVLASADRLAALGLRIERELDFSAAMAADAQLLRAASGAKGGLPRLAVIKLTDSTLSIEEGVARLNASGLVAYAEPDFVMDWHRASPMTKLSERVVGGSQLMATPNDPLYSSQYHHNSSAVPGADIDSALAWDANTGSRGAGAPVVAIMDCGFMTWHPDLNDNWWVNPAPTFGDNNGADFYDNDGDPVSPDGCNHGTQVAGVIGAEGNNGVGVAGVLWATRMMALRVGGEGGLPTSAVIAAANYVIARKAAGVNVRVVNMSFGGAPFSQTFYDALASLNDAGILVVASAGNDGNDVPNFPAAYNLPNIISVGATDASGALASFSNYGSSVHIAAPGDGIWTTSFDSGWSTNYEAVSGTSFSAPVVAGIATLVLNASPTLTVQALRQRVLGTPLANAQLDGKTRIAAIASSRRALDGASEYLRPSMWHTRVDGPAPQYAAGATHLIRAYVGLGPQSSGVKATIGGTDYNLRDDGLYPDDFAGDGAFAGLVRHAGVGAQGFALKHSTVSAPDPVSATRVLSASVSFHIASNYQRQTGTAAWLTPTAATTLMGVNADDVAVNVTMPFGFSFYGQPNVNQLKVYSNGIICVGAKPCALLSEFDSYQNQALPSGLLFRQGQAILAPWWNDWSTASSAGLSGAVTTHIEGAAPNRRFVVTWRDMVPFQIAGIATDGVSFQVQLRENDSAIVFAYADVTTDAPATSIYFPDGGKLGTIGIQYPNGKIATRLGFNQAGILTAGQADTYVLGASFPTELTNATDPDLFMSVEGLRGANITTGCAGGTSFCGTTQITRIQMAAFLARSKLGHDGIADYSGFIPANFPDVTTAPNTNYVSALKGLGITNGCMGGTMYCPNNSVNREQMALFLQRAVRGASYVPPPATGQFSDAPVGYANAATFEELRRMGITNGCNGGTAFCPGATVTRNQMAQFLQRAFRPWEH